MLKQQTKLRVRLYARLSKDDGDADKESNSITNQLQMLRYNAKEKGFEVIGEYVDDGYSGTTFNRPDLNRMIKDAMDDPEPSGIMVKDMSRFGRNNAMFMYYVEEIFPNNDILFIALNDDVDTRFDENEMMPFKSIMNEYYARDTSKKIRSVKKTTALSGGFCGSFAPYANKTISKHIDHGSQSHSLFGVAQQFDMLLVERNTNLEEVGNALLLHRRDILLFFNLCQSFLGRSLKLSVNARFGNAIL